MSGTPRTCGRLSLSILSVGATLMLAASSLQAGADPVLAVLEAFHADGQFDGAVLVYKDDNPILRQGFGLADIEKGTPNSPDTRFDIASITKAFTATLVLQLVQEEKWSLDSAIGEFLPELEAPAVRAITLQQLLVHSSGMGRDHTEFFPSNRQDLGFEDLIHVLNTSSLIFEPGTRHVYSNSGYVVLRYALERVTGKGYEQLLGPRILEPLGMKSTGVIPADRSVEGLAKGYSTWLITKPSPGRLRQGASGDLLGASGLYSTVDDLWRFLQGIESHKILDKTRTDLLWPVEEPGMAWEILEIPGKDDERTRLLVTTGASPLGHLSAVAWLPSKNSGYIVLSNTEAPGRAGFPSILVQMERALGGREITPIEVPDTPIRDVLATLFDKGVDAAMEAYRALEKPQDFRARASAAQAAGAPDAPPGETPRAWASLTPNDRPEWLELWYEPAVPASEIRVYETQIPGAISSVEIRSPEKQKLRFSTEKMTRTVSQAGVPISVIPIPSGMPIEYLTLHLDAPGTPGWTQIDAVGLLHGIQDVHWATGARASSTAADGVPLPIHSFPTNHALTEVARAYHEAGDPEKVAQIRALLGELRNEP